MAYLGFHKGGLQPTPLPPLLAPYPPPDPRPRARIVKTRRQIDRSSAPSTPLPPLLPLEVAPLKSSWGSGRTL